MAQSGSYQIQSVSRNTDQEIKRLKAQVDIFWPQEFLCYKEFGLQDGMSMVELGCGPGYLLEMLLSAFPKINAMGVEIDPLLTKNARNYLSERAPQRHHIIQASIMETGLKKNAFDFAITRLVLEHLPDPLPAIKEVLRILRPGGRAVFIDNDFEMHLVTYPSIPELSVLYDAYCKSRIAEGGNPKIGRQLPGLLKKVGYNDVDLRIISAHSDVCGVQSFLASEGIGIPVKLVKDGYLTRESLNKIAIKWRTMLKDKDHAITRQLYMAVGEKPETEVIGMSLLERTPLRGSTTASNTRRLPKSVKTSSNGLSPLENASDAVEFKLKELVIDVLKNSADNDDCSEISPCDERMDADFSELGINSVTSVDLTEAIKQFLGVNVGIDVIFDCRNIKELTQYLGRHYQTQCMAKILSQQTTPQIASVSRPVSEFSGRCTAEAVARVKEPSSEQKSPEEQPKEEAYTSSLEPPVAIIGVSGRFAGAETVNAFWENLENGRCCIAEVRREGWDVQEFYHPDPNISNKSISKWGGLLGEVDRFDALFFNISPREARTMEPCQRLFLEESYRAFEDAGYSPSELSGQPIGVFAGMRTSDYSRLLYNHGFETNALLAADLSIVPARVSYFFDLTGPSMTVDTACSSSLVAVHLAMESIRRGESKMALAGGAFVMNTPEYYLLASKTNILSPAGRCRAFDNNADGFVPGEGVGAVVLKRLDQALADGDYIYGVIKAAAINHDGKTNGIMAPSSASQQRLLRETYSKACINPETISYIEANGVGSKLGDTIEIRALMEVFRSFTQKKQFCAIGSHKPNIGHTLTASGIAGIIKVLLSMKQGLIPPMIGFDELNPIIHLDGSPFYVNSQCRSWEKKNETPRRAAISSFGLGGTNCHLVLEESPRRRTPARSDDRPVYLIPISARSSNALAQKIEDLKIWLAKHNGYGLQDIAGTLQLGRNHFAVRSAFIATDTQDLREKIDAVHRAETPNDYWTTELTGQALKTTADQKTQLAELLAQLSSGRHQQPEAATYQKKLSLVAQWYVRGLDVDWSAITPKQSFNRLPLPVYPFVDAQRLHLSAAGNSKQADPQGLSAMISKVAAEYLHGGLVFRRDIDALERLGCLALLDTLRKMDGLCVAQETYSKTSLKNQLAIASQYDRLFDALLEILARAGFIRMQGQMVTFLPPSVDDPALQKTLNDLEAQQQLLVQRRPALQAHVDFLWPCIQNFSKILRGQIPPTDIIFPNSSMTLVEGIYKGNPVADLFNRLVAGSTRTYVENKLPLLGKDDKIKIIEVGAGTGGTSEFVLAAIEPFGERIKYLYTDISIAFTKYGRNRFAEKYPFLAFKVLNVEHEIVPQGFGAGDFDVVIAANVLHATSDIRITLGRVKTLLKKKGWLILNEMTGLQDYLTLTFGLLDGWWLFKDPQNRLQGAPLIDSGVWAGLLREAGFDTVTSACEQIGPQATRLCQDVLVAESNGVANSPALEHGGAPRPRERVEGLPRPATLPGPRPASTSAQKADREGSTKRAAPSQVTRRSIEATIMDHVAAVIEVQAEALDVDCPYTDFGVDSILAVEIINRINAQLSIELSSTDLFNYTTIKTLAGHIAECFGPVADTDQRVSVCEDIEPDDQPTGLHSGSPALVPDSGGLPVSTVRPHRCEEIAIIGMASQFPGAQNLDQYGHNLLKGRNCIQEIPVDRWRLDLFYDTATDTPARSYSKWGGFLDDIHCFDPLFFNISRKEAELMDPRQRLFLQEAWKALEDAGYTDRELDNAKCGVFIGCGPGDYKPVLAGAKMLYDAYAFMGNASSILPSRISYFLNLKGPSLAVDTACSSSLVAIHLACEDIRNGSSDLAIAGGVSLLTTPELYILASKAAMLSPAGQCRAFDQHADGFVPAEGVGIVVLKSLSAALNDGDHIHAVIKGSGVNQDGKTNGITAPNGPSQTSLQTAVYKKFGIDPATITLVEAHGTGTKLGDPIEVNALSDSLRKFTDKKNYCAIGSVKTNIGHALEAAGVAGLIKLILCMRYKKLVPSLNFVNPNEHINFKESPLYVCTQTADWPAGPEGPRRAAINAFGFSGTNAHVVIEEAPAWEPDRSCAQGAQAMEADMPFFLMPLSAKTESALERKLEDMRNWLALNEKSVSLGDIAFTLSVGRSHFPVRCAFIAKDHGDLKQKLEAALSRKETADCLRSDLNHTPPGPEPALKALGAALTKELCGGALTAGQYQEKLLGLADLYVKGHEPDFRDFYHRGMFRRISLPVYPFARDDCRVAALPEHGPPHADTQALAANPHPMIHRHRSNHREPRFSAVFSGREFFLADHVINGAPMLPGVAYLEMGRAAAQIAAKKPVTALRHIVWARPITIPEAPLEVHIRLSPAKAEESRTFEVLTHTDDHQTIVHARGELNYASIRTVEHATDPIDLAAIRMRCPDTLSQAACYHLFQALGLDYGLRFQGIRTLMCNEREALAQLELPAALDGVAEDFVLHPTLLDGALQTVIGQTAYGAEEKAQLYLPYSLDALEIVEPVVQNCYAYVEMVEDYLESRVPMKRFAIRIADETGRVLVKMKDLIIRPPRSEASSEKPLPHSGSAVTMYFQETWQPADAFVNGCQAPSLGRWLIFDTQASGLRSGLQERLQAAGLQTGRVTWVYPATRYLEHEDGGFEIDPTRIEDYEKLVARLVDTGGLPRHIVHLWSREDFSTADEALGRQLARGLYAVFFLSQAIMRQKPRHRIDLLYVFPSAGNVSHPLGMAMGGMVMTLYQENPNFNFKTVELDLSSSSRQDSAVSPILDLVWSEFGLGRDYGVQVRYATQQRRIKRMQPIAPPAQAHHKHPLLREAGVYLITGGSGGLGLIFARHLAQKVRARLILTGRSTPGATEQQKIKQIESLGGEVVHMRTDVSQPQEVNALVEQARSRFGRIHGVIHAAGINRDAFILKKRKEEIDAVLAAKVYGTVCLDAALKSEPLDFFVLFSSTSAVLGNVGQCDYAFGNAFMDAFARWRQDRMEQGRRSGKTLSINWPLWRSGGMNVDEALQRDIEARVGMTLMNIEDGLRAFESALALDTPHVMVIQGDEGKISRALGLTGSAVCPCPNHQPGNAGPQTASRTHPASAALKERIEHYLKMLIARETKTPLQHIHADAPFEQFGIESVMIMNLNRALEERFGELSKTLFFEYRNLTELAVYFLQHHREKLAESLDPPAALQAQGGPAAAQTSAPEKPDRHMPSRPLPKRMPTGFVDETGSQGIAIIGISGRFPMAPDLQTFWENLKVGRDCIVEIPRERWDNRRYFGPKGDDVGVTYSKWGGFMDDVDKFDPLFFNISPRDAEIMDPQERLFLEIAWEVLEDAGYTRQALADRAVGVFAGVMWGHYQMLGAEKRVTAKFPALDSSFASIANRVSYFLNFQGPSIAVDTMCSSSLTTIHLACQSLYRGESDLCLAGGINLTVHPDKYIYLSQGKFAASDGRCRSFGADGDGYVPGEGAGAVLLKPFDQALADKDHIYAVIKASAINHGGKTNGYSVPNPNAQANLISEALRRSQVNPRTISYLEAHGTGTALGDPIEITGLTKAFRAYTADRAYCAIGSVKSNIGHLESAAGVAGLAKVLLQMKHRMLVPSIHSQPLNPNINFTDSPFYVQRELARWPAPVIQIDGAEKQYPRRAAISAFGAGGANAHLVLEEYEAPPTDCHTADNMHQIFVLSAKNRDRLKAYALKMGDFLSSCTDSLASVAYTLQTGREAMTERLAVVASQMQTLSDQLRRYGRGQQDIDHLFSGNIKAAKQINAGLLEDEEGQAYIKTLLKNRKLDKIAHLWVSGMHIDWPALYPGPAPARVSLPSYPFDRQHCWVPEVQAPYPNAGQVPKLHPLVERNTSTLQLQRFTTQLTGDEFFMKDHKVADRLMLPGAAYIEMARAAGEIAESGKIVSLRNIIWSRPLTVADHPQQVQISLFEDPDGVAYEIGPAGTFEQTMICCQGKLLSEDRVSRPPVSEPVDIAAVKGRCLQIKSKEQYYESLRKMGLEYGPGLQPICELSYNGNEAISLLELPAHLEDGFEAFVLHPSLMDGALQTAASLLPDPDRSGLFLPFALGRLEIREPLGKTCYAYVTTNGSDSRNVKAYMIQLLDADGRVVVDMHDFSVRAVEQRSAAAQTDALQTLYFKPVWKRFDLGSGATPLPGPLMVFDTDTVLYDEIKKRFADTVCILVTPGTSYRAEGNAGYCLDPENSEDYQRMMQAIAKNHGLPGAIIFKWSQTKPDDDAVDHRLRFGIYALTDLSQAILAQKPEARIRLLHLHDAHDPFQEAVSGFAKTLRLENSKLVLKSVAFEDSYKSGAYLDKVLDELQADDEAAEIRYRDEQRWHRQFEEIDPVAETSVAVLLKEERVYLITGGLGGLGLLFAEYLAREWRATLVLAGRSPLTEESSGKLQQLQTSGARVVYIQADVSKQEETQALIETIKSRYQRLDGILHAAGVLQDGLIRNKTRSQMAAVLAPKLRGTLFLDRATQEEALDFFVLFSSVTGVMGNQGQCDYAYANSYLDAFARLRETWRKQGRRKGKTLSLNWPLWQQGGMTIDEQTQLRLARHTGMHPLPTEEGLAAFVRALSFDTSQTIVVQGARTQLYRYFGITGDSHARRTDDRPDRPAAKEPTPDAGTPAQQQVEQDLIRLCSELLKVNSDDLDTDAELSEYGVDSIMMMTILNRVEALYGQPVSPNAISEYPTLKRFAGYLCSEGIVRAHKSAPQEPQPAPAADATDMRPPASLIRGPKKRLSRSAPPLRCDPASDAGKIAVIGAACRFPGSPRIEDFWENLCNARSSISEVPPDRWSVADYYSPDKTAPNKSYSKWAGYLDQIDLFDAAYFGISDEDALGMDPQQHIVLELTQELLDRAGYTKADLAATPTSVFLGAGESAYVRNNLAIMPPALMKHLVVNRIQNMTASRISDFYNLTGGSQTIDTACSSSLVAIHQACQEIQVGTCRMAIAGGVELLLDPYVHVGFSKAEALSDEERSYIFDQRANGFVLGEGAGLVLLKSLPEAIGDGDRILGVITATAVNNDGRTMGLTVPNLEGQKAVIQEAVAKAGVNPDTITYLEAHGTGTLLGDPIEIKAISKVYRAYTEAVQYCAVGSVKSNIGHLLHAAGVASFIKVLLALQHGKIPATLHCETPHPRFKFETTPFYPAVKTELWTPECGIRRAAVSSFGFGGTNCHLIMEAYPTRQDNAPIPGRKALPLTQWHRKSYWLGQSRPAGAYSKTFASDDPILEDHRILGASVLMGVVHCSLAMDAARATYADHNLLAMRNIRFSEVIRVEPASAVQVTVEVKEKGARFFFENTYHSTGHSDVRPTANGELIFNAADDLAAEPLDIAAVRQGATEILSADAFYANSPIYGPSLYTLKEVYRLADGVLGRIALTPSMAAQMDDYTIHPALLDSGCAIINFLFADAGHFGRDAYIPIFIKEILLLDDTAGPGYCRCRLVKQTAELVIADTWFYDRHGRALMLCKGLSIKRVPSLEALDNSARPAPLPSGSHGQSEHPVPPPDPPAEPGDPTVPETSAVCASPDAGEDAADRLQGQIENFIVKTIQPLVKSPLKPPDKQKNFMDLGVDSTQLIQVTSQFEQQFGIELYPTLFFEYQNINELTAYFYEQHAERLADHFGLTPLDAQVSLPKGVSLDDTPASGRTEDFAKAEPPAKTAKGTAPPKKQQADVLRDDIAIIGMAGVFAESPDLAAFWHNLRDRRDLIKEIPPDHFDYRPWFDPQRRNPDTLYCKWGSFIDDVDVFDAGFFNISPREAEVMDPQLRLLLQVMYATAEDAGCPATIRGTNTGVYVGVCFHDYQKEMDRLGKPIAPHDGTGNAATMIANRPSFCLNLTGPSMAIDTACSSSLVALHLACRALNQNECEMAYAAGTNLLLSASHYRYFCSLGVLSPTGRNHTFDKRADGYVPGEGVGAVLLKPLRRAMADGDRIHAVVKGSAVKHGGYTQSVTAPSAKLQAQVILDAWQDAGIAAESIGLIEAQGIGTQLGDPVEIEALKKAFAHHGIKQKQCAVGSAKAHIGHTEGAAGIAGVLKAVLCMQNREIPAMPLFEELNPYIRLEDTPLYINPQNQAWPEPQTGPRHAGISAFGFGGTYAHVVLEEYRPAASDSAASAAQAPGDAWQVIPLSARNPDRLTAYANQLADCLEAASNGSKPSTAAVAYTLQTGREAMPRRMALVAADIDDLIKKLRQYGSGQQDIDNLFEGHTKSKDAISETLLDGREGRQFVQSVIHDKKLAKLARLWVSGAPIDWRLLYAGSPPPRITLPTYPFAKERYWIPPEQKPEAEKTVIRLHPMIERNISTLQEEKFSVRFSGDEFFLRDHQISGAGVLPAVAYLEMVRIAADIAGAGKIRKIRNVLWLRPIRVEEQPREVCINLYPRESSVDYDIGIAEEEQSPIVCCQGSIAGQEGEEIPTEPTPIDLQAVKERCSRMSSAQQCYAAFEKIGIHYGSGFQPICELHSNGREALARLELPPSVAHSLADFGLHPSLMDGALQTVIGLWPETEDSGLFLPFSLGALEIFEPLTQSCYAYATVDDAAKENMRACDIQIASPSGQVLVRMQRIMLRQVRPAAATAPNVPATRYYQFIWEAQPDQPVAGAEVEQAVAGPVLVFEREPALCEALRKDILSDGAQDCTVIQVSPGDKFEEQGDGCFQIAPEAPEQYERLLAALADRLQVPRLIIHRWSQALCDHDMDGVAAQLQDGFHSIFHLTRALLALKPAEAIRVLYLYPDPSGCPQPVYAGLAGFARALRQESTVLAIKSIALADESKDARMPLIDVVQREWCPDTWDQDQDALAIRYADGRRWILQPQALALDDQPLATEKLRHRGVYLITGGAGGLGLIFARHLAQRVQARLVLCGRSKPDAKLAEQIKALEGLGGEAIYLQADVSRRQEVARLIDTITKRFECLHGVIHAAGTIQDNLMLKKSFAEALAVLAPKVYGAVHLDAATRTLALDFFILFASVSGVMGNVGQCDYAYANAFLDHFAHWREEQRRAGRRAGKTLSLDWPLWRQGGMQVDDQTLAWLERRYGIAPLETEEGLNAFERLLACDPSQVLVKPERRQPVGPHAVQDLPSHAPETDAVEPETRIAADLVEMCAAILKVAADDLDSETHLGDYGLDSILTMTLLNQIEARYGTFIEPYAVVEHPSIGQLARYLAGQGLAPAEKENPLPVNSIQEHPLSGGLADLAAPQPRERTAGRFRRFGDPRPAAVSVPKDKIAVIGMACRFPKADSPETFWDHLQHGRYLVGEVPPDRWSLDDFYSPDKSAPNRSYAKWGGFVDGIELFDSEHFGISESDALIMDPQHRILLELSRHLMDRSGYGLDEIKDTRTGVFVGGKASTYTNSLKDRIPVAAMKHAVVSSIQNMLAARISDFYDLTGPSHIVDTACSSSLVAIHQACQSLRSGECRMAIAGGIEIYVDPLPFIWFSKADVLSDDGRSYVFDERANGIVLGEGAGLVLVKPLAAAHADGDNILAVICGSAVNNDGRTLGVTVPDIEGQKDVIRLALADSGIDPQTIGYLEAHGTGTLLGDPIEVRAATQVYREFTQAKHYCGVGSVKSNIGHLMHAAGVASLIKVLLALHNGRIPPTLHCERPHPRFQFETSPFFPVTSPMDWVPRNGVRRAAISSFGFGGTNCHMVLEALDDRRRSQHGVRRSPLAPTVFQRKRFWLGKPIVSEAQLQSLSFDETAYRNLLRKLQSGELSPAQSLQMATQLGNSAKAVFN